MENIKVNHHFIGASKLEKIDFCGNTWGWKLTNEAGMFTPPYKLLPIDGEHGEHDYNKCETCQQSLKNLIEGLTLGFNGKGKTTSGEIKPAFPNCCSQHANLTNLKQFDIGLFLGVPEMTAQKIIYTNQVLINSAKSEDWYKEITDYIELAVETFGDMPKGCGAPLFLDQYFKNVKHLIETKPVLKKKQKTLLLQFIKGYEVSNQPDKANQTDLNILIQTYEKWYKIFPFDLLSYFGNLKEHFGKAFPIANGRPETNMYSRVTKVKMHTKESLIEALVNLTDSLLTQINAVTLYEKGLITDGNKLKLEVAISERKLKLKQGYKNDSSSEENRYRKILKEWFLDEEKFIEKITPLLKISTPTPEVETKSVKLKTSLSQFGFENLPLVKALTQESKDKLVELLNSKGLPYSIAMFDYLGFIKHLEKEHLPTKYKLEKEVAKWFNVSKDGRAVKGNLNSLMKNSKDNKNRYTAFKHKETVKEDYQKLK